MSVAVNRREVEKLKSQSASFFVDYIVQSKEANIVECGAGRSIAVVPPALVEIQ